MIQYLINASAIWLLSLLVFDLWLRKSTHHTYNRIYLIVTALIGALAPLYQPGQKFAQISPVLSKPMIAVTDIKQTIANATTIPQNAFPWATWILGTYILGIAISCAVLLREGILLLRWYQRADKQLYGDFRLVVTHRDHGPFSILGYIFVCDSETYRSDELRFILQHESVHIRRRHFADKALLLLLRCVFWFHPLSWIYYSRLMMIHEYEADDTAREATRDYAHFLIHQQLTGTAPLLAHSFFHSPLKNRIRMLTAKRSRNWRKAGHLLALPAIAVFAILWVNNSTAHKREKHGNMVTFGSNTFEMGLPTMGGKPLPAGAQTMVIMGSTKEAPQNADPNEAKSKTINAAPVEYVAKAPMSISITLDSVPVKMNGQLIYETKNLSAAPALSGRSKSVLSILVNGAQEEFNKLPDGIYNLIVNNMIVDVSGRLVYYTTSPVFLRSGTFSLAPGEDFEAAEAAAKKEKEAHPIPEAVQAEIRTAVEQMLDGLVLIPGKLNGKAVIARADISPGYAEVIEVKNHRAYVARLN